MSLQSVENQGEILFEIILAFILLVIGLAAVVKGADFLVDGASSFAKKAGIPEIVIGLTIVAFGTSAPELIVNIFASIQGSNEIVFGNIIGSNVFNTMLILGIAGLIYPLAVQRNTVLKEIPFSLGSIVLLLFLVNDQIIFRSKINVLGRIDGVILLVLFVVFIVYVFIISKVKIFDEEEHKILPVPLIILFLILGITGLFIGGKLVVDNAVKIARFLNVSEKLISLTIISCGTSLPELATSAVAAFKKRNDIAVGNIIGSNIFNVLLVLGISSVIRPLGFTFALNVDIILLIVISSFLFATMFIGKEHKFRRWQAIIFLIVYVGYMSFIIIRK